MLGIIVILIISWILLHATGNAPVKSLGLQFKGRQFFFFGVGLIVAAAPAGIYLAAVGFLSGAKLIVNQLYQLQHLMEGMVWVGRSVIFEELVFRGALFFLLWKHMGWRLACLLSSMAFGMYHWFSYSVLGEPLMMTTVFVLTFAAGMAFSYSFVKSGTVLMPIGLHLGWNLVIILVFSQGPLGRQWLTIENGGPLSASFSWMLYALQVVMLPVFVYWYFKKPKRKYSSVT